MDTKVSPAGVTKQTQYTHYVSHIQLYSSETKIIKQYSNKQ